MIMSRALTMEALYGHCTILSHNPICWLRNLKRTLSLIQFLPPQILQPQNQFYFQHTHSPTSQSDAVLWVEVCGLLSQCPESCASSPIFLLPCSSAKPQLCALFTLPQKFYYSSARSRSLGHRLSYGVSAVTGKAVEYVRKRRRGHSEFWAAAW